MNPGTVLAQAQPMTGKEGKVTQPSPESWYVLNDDPVLNGQEIKNPRQSFDNGGSGAPNVTFEFDSKGISTFKRVTREIAERGQREQLPGVSKEAAQQHFAVVLDNQIITAPFINYTENPEGIDPTTGSQISGGFTLTSAQNLADELQSGALPIKLELISQSQVSATLGKTALKQGLIAGLVGLLVVCLFLLAFYRVLGAIAVGGLVIYGIYFFALIKLIPITLTLPGIAGLILTIGIAADANIVIFERVKEEIRGGRSIAAGIATGYKRGFAAIVDANVVTFMTAFILFALATSEVQGFAFTLGIGTLLTLFTAVLATQAALGAMGRSRAVSHPALLGASKRNRKWTFDFMGASRWFFSLSGCILMIGALAIGGRGLNLGIDFTSGTRIQTAFVKHVSENQVQSAIAEAGYPSAEVQGFTNKSIGGQGYQISLKKLKPEEVVKVKEALDKKFGSGPQFAGDEELLEHIDRTDLRPDRRQKRDHRDHRLAAGDLGIYRPAIRMEVRGSGPDRLDARPAYHQRRVCADRPRSDDLHRGGAADDPWLFDVRHDHRVRSCARERAAYAASGVLADRQPLDVRGLDPIAGHQLLHAAAGHRDPAVRRLDAEGLRVRDARRYRLGRILLDLSSPRRCSRTGRSARASIATAVRASCAIWATCRLTRRPSATARSTWSRRPSPRASAVGRARRSLPRSPASSSRRRSSTSWWPR